MPHFSFEFDVPFPIEDIDSEFEDLDRARVGGISFFASILRDRCQVIRFGELYKLCIFDGYAVPVCELKFVAW